MRPLFNYILMFLAVILSIFLGLRIAQPETVGHWHVVQTLGSDEHPMNFIHHFNVYPDGTVLLNEVNGRGAVMSGRLDRIPHKMYLGGECLSVNASYRISDNRMDITGGGEYGPVWRVVAFRTEPGDCDPERDFFAGNPLDIRLPQFGLDLRDEPAPAYSDFTFYIGEDKHSGQVTMFANRHAEIENTEQLRDFVARHNHLVVVGMQRVIYVYQDEEVDATEQLALLAEEFGGSDGVAPGYYRVYREPDSPGLTLRYRWVPFPEE